MVLALDGSNGVARGSTIAPLLCSPGGRAFEIRHVQSQDQIRLRDDLVILSAEVKRVLHREIEPPELIEHRRSEQLCQFAHGFESGFLSPHRVGDYHRPLRFEEPTNSLFESLFRRLQGERRGIAIQRRKSNFPVQLFFLHVAVVADVDGPHRVRCRQPIRADERVWHSLNAGRLIVPLDEVTN